MYNNEQMAYETLPSPKRSQIDEQMINLETACNQNREIIHELETRLSMILCDKKETVSSGNLADKNGIPVRKLLSMDINNISSMMRENNNKITSIIERLEL